MPACDTKAGKFKRDWYIIFGPWFKGMMKDLFGLKIIHIPINSPQKNVRSERLNRTIKEEALDNIIAA